MTVRPGGKETVDLYHVISVLCKELLHDFIECLFQTICHHQIFMKSNLPTFQVVIGRQEKLQK